MKIYIATRLENAAQHQELAKELVSLGHTITYDWTSHGSVQRDPSRIATVAQAEAEGVRDADVLIALLPGGCGTHCEIGMAIALGKRVLLWAEATADFFHYDEKTCVFYHHPLVRTCGGKWKPRVLALLVACTWVCPNGPA